MTILWINRAQWEAFEKAGFDMRQFRLIGRLPA